MAANDAKHGGPPKAGKEGKPIKDETIAKAAGVLVGAGIAWSLFRSVTGRGNKKQFVHTQEHVTKEGESKEKVCITPMWFLASGSRWINMN